MTKAWKHHPANILWQNQHYQETRLGNQSVLEVFTSFQQASQHTPEVLLPCLRCVQGAQGTCMPMSNCESSVRQARKAQESGSKHRTQEASLWGQFTWSCQEKENQEPTYLSCCTESAKGEDMHALNFKNSGLQLEVFTFLIIKSKRKWCWKLCNSANLRNHVIQIQRQLQSHLIKFYAKLAKQPDANISKIAFRASGSCK